jgi:hypothetical protein
MKISLIHPSRGRAEKAYQTIDNWLNKSTGEIEIEYILSLDKSDPRVSDYMEEYNHYFDLLVNRSEIIVNDNDCVVQATNQAAKIATGDILIYLSDDFDCPLHWDKLIEEHLPKNIYDPFLIKVDDCLQKFFIPVLTIPIMSKALYNKLGYFWHIEYRSMFCDEHLYWICKNNNWLIMAEDLKFPHLHPANGKAENDDTYKASAANWDQGKRVFAKHKLENFPL